jgi:hypothetical protein
MASGRMCRLARAWNSAQRSGVVQGVMMTPHMCFDGAAKTSSVLKMLTVITCHAISCNHGPVLGSDGPAVVHNWSRGAFRSHFYGLVRIISIIVNAGHVEYTYLML